VDDPCGLTGRNGDHFEHQPVTVRTDDEEPLLAFIFVLDQCVAFRQAWSMSASWIPCLRADGRISTRQRCLDV
jgi:hypothetical protein